MSDRNSRSYLIRLEKARIENEDKKKRVYWNPRGSLPRQTSHYSNTLTLPNNNNFNNTFIKEDNFYINKNNSILGSGSDKGNRTINYNLKDTKRNLKNELLNIECLTIKTESDEE